MIEGVGRYSNVTLSINNNQLSNTQCVNDQIL